MDKNEAKKKKKINVLFNGLGPGSTVTYITDEGPMLAEQGAYVSMDEEIANLYIGQHLCVKATQEEADAYYKHHMRELETRQRVIEKARRLHN